MAYAEKRGKGRKPWRVKYKKPDGSWDGEPGFETKKAALEWGHDQESLIRRGGWIDPKGGDLTLREWIEDYWWPAQDLALNSRKDYRWVIDSYLLPKFGGRPLNTFTSPTEINAWELELKKVVPGAATNARARLCTILGDAVGEGRIQVNVARRASRRRGRKVKVAGREQERITVTPLQVLLFAERASLVTGNPADLIMMIQMAYTGMRWGETVGLEPHYLRPGLIRVDWQLGEVGGVFFKSTPKDAGMRDVDLPPFLDKLMHEELHPVRCGHGPTPDSDLPELADSRDIPCPGGVQYLYLTTANAHPQNRQYASRVFDPAADGWWKSKNGPKESPKRVLVDTTPGWPGTPLKAPWPAAEPGVEWSIPRGPGRPKRDWSRLSPATWLPLAPGLHPHAFKHAHRTWMDEDGIPEVLKRDRLGHDWDGIQAVYSHVTPGMKAELKMALEGRWESSLRQRAAMDPHSPVELLDGLLKPYRRAIGSGSPKYRPSAGSGLSGADLAAPEGPAASTS